MLTKEMRERYLTVSQAANLLDLPVTPRRARQFLREEIKAGRLVADCIPGKRPLYLIKPDKLEEFKQRRLSAQSVRCTCQCHETA